jgi:hypothetical protein
MHKKIFTFIQLVAVHKFEKTTETAMTLEFNPKVAGFECRL